MPELTPEQWKRFGLYMADCQLATAFTVLERKSSSKSEKYRQRLIVEAIVKFLKHGETPRARPIEEVVKRADAIPKEPS